MLKSLDTEIGNCTGQACGVVSLCFVGHLLALLHLGAYVHAALLHLGAYVRARCLSPE